MQKKIKLTIIIPARNEEGIIAKTLDEIYKKVKVPFKVLVVDDMSVDGTSLIVKNYIKTHKNVELIKTSINKNGFSAALEKGIKNVKTDYFVVVMADLSDKPTTINKMYELIQGRWDLVCGSRYAKGGKKIGGPKLQGFFSKLVCISLHKLIGIPTADVSNAFKMYKKKALKRVSFNSESGVEASMEIVLQCFFNEAKIVDLPTTWKGRTVGKSKFKILWRAPRYFRIYIWSLENALRKMFKIPRKKFYAG